MKFQKENKCHERMGMCMEWKKGLNALFSVPSWNIHGIRKVGKTFIFARIPEEKQAVQWALERRRARWIKS